MNYFNYITTCGLFLKESLTQGNSSRLPGGEYTEVGYDMNSMCIRKFLKSFLGMSIVARKRFC
jgi:hypothetical protein